MTDKTTQYQKDNNLSKDISDIINKSYNLHFPGTSSNSIPSTSMDFTFEYAPTDVTLRHSPLVMKKPASKNAFKAKRGNLRSTSEATTLSFVIDTWKSKGNAKTSLRQRRKMDILEEDAVNKNKLPLASKSVKIQRNAVNKWKALKTKKS